MFRLKQRDYFKKVPLGSTQKTQEKSKVQKFPNHKKGYLAEMVPDTGNPRRLIKRGTLNYRRARAKTILGKFVRNPKRPEQLISQVTRDLERLLDSKQSIYNLDKYHKELEYLKYVEFSTVKEKSDFLNSIGSMSPVALIFALGFTIAPGQQFIPLQLPDNVDQPSNQSPLLSSLIPRFFADSFKHNQLETENSAPHLLRGRPWEL